MRPINYFIVQCIGLLASDLVHRVFAGSYVCRRSQLVVRTIRRLVTVMSGLYYRP